MIIIISMILILTAAYVYALDYPHTDEGTSGQNFMSCGDCHFSHGDPIWWDGTQADLDDTFYNNQCWSCHDDSRAPYKLPHSSINLSTQYGDWGIQCWQCHDAHAQEQIDEDIIDNERFVYEGTVTSVTPNSPVAGESTIVEAGRTWADQQYSEIIAPQSFYEIVPNVLQDFYVYKIKSTNAATNEIIVDGVVNTSFAAPGDTLRIYLGKLNRSLVGTPDRPTCSIINNEYVCSNTVDKPVKWKERTGPSSFADGDSVYDGMCEICHTQTNYHRNNASGIHEHNKTQNCTDCHNHLDGFKVDEAICSTCHGYPPIENVPNQSSTNQNSGMVDLFGNIQSPTPGSTGSATPGAHDLHYNTQGFGCAVCHFGSAGTSTSHNSDLSITLGFSLFSGFYQGGNYDGQLSVTAGYNTAPTPTSPATTVSQTGSKTCSNIYCHSNVQDDGGLGTRTYSSPVWDDPVSAQCGECHNADGTGNGTYMNSGTHTKHVQVQFYTCTACHWDGGSGTANHPNNNIDITFDPAMNPSGVYSQLNNTPGNKYGYCSSLECHGPNTPQWGGTNPTADCTWCHGNNASSASPMALINHPDHINNASVIGDNFACAQCHDATVDIASDQNITNRTVHANGTKNIQFLKDPEGIADWTSPTCSSVYCHSTGRTASDVPTAQLPGVYGSNHYRSMTWGDGIDLKCNGCHGRSNSDGYPDYSQIGVAGGTDANTHQRHVADKGINCSACHNDTTLDGKTIKAGSLHLNESRDIAIAAAYDLNGASTNYDQGTKTCSAVSCHDAGSPSFTPVWGSNIAGDCSDCHAFPPATGAHATHVQNSGLLTPAYGNAEVVSDSGNYAFGCGNCHPTDPALHQNNVVDIDLTPGNSTGGPLKALNEAGANRSGSGNTSVCSQIYCHSNGGVDVASAASPQWGGTFAGDRCAGCHENSPTGTATHAKHVVGIHYNSIYSGTTGNATTGIGNTNSHGNASVSTTINCDICHNNTLDVGSRGYAASRNDNNTVCNSCHNAEGNEILSSHLDKSRHVSGAVDVQFDQTVTVRSKAQVRVLDATVPELNNVWTRQVGYKVAGAYDLANSALNTAAMYDPDSKTCAVTCHNNRSSTWGESNVSCFYCHTELPETP